MKYYLIAGEASGDMHGSHLIQALKSIDKSMDFHFWGGDMMAQQGGTQVMHYRETAIMGFIEVVKNLSKIRSFFALAKKDILVYNPDIVIFIDYPGFNLRMAKWAKIQGFKTVYYITPTVWAWNKSRVHTLRKYIDLSIPILPFEKPFLDKFEVPSIYHGHPLVDIISKFTPNPSFQNHDSRPKLAILPGSRVQEIKRLLPVMLRAACAITPKYKLLVAAMRSIDQTLYQNAINDAKIDINNIELIYDQTYDLIKSSNIAIVGSGTATLEVALLGTPQVVCYIGSAISVKIAKALLDIKFISLPNLIQDSKIVTELIQDDCNETSILQEIKAIERQPETMINNYASMCNTLGNDNSLPKIASSIYQLIS